MQNYKREILKLVRSIMLADFEMMREQWSYCCFILKE